MPPFFISRYSIYNNDSHLHLHFGLIQIRTLTLSAQHNTFIAVRD